MFVEHKEKGEVAEAPAKVLKLSEVVRIAGYEKFASVRECVLARAYRYVTGKNVCDSSDWYSRGDYGALVTMTADKFGIPCKVADEAENMCLYRHSKDEIADWLESQGC